MGAKTETGIEMNTEGKDPPETKAAATPETNGWMTGPLVTERDDDRDVILRKADIMEVILRSLCLLTSVTALSLMVTAKEASTITVYGFNIPLSSKWSFSYAFDGGGSRHASAANQRVKAGVSNLNHTGIRHLALPDLCKPLRGFCDRVAASIAFAFLSCFLLAVSVVADVVWLSKS